MKNFYEVLQVRTNATQSQIKKAYIDLMTKYHPDVYRGDKDYAEQYTSIITQAYSTLKDETKRGQYDLRHGINSHPNAWQLKREDREIERQKRTTSNGQNLDQQISREYFKNTKRKKPEKSGFRKILSSKLFFGVMALILVEVAILMIFYYKSGN